MTEETNKKTTTVKTKAPKYNANTIYDASASEIRDFAVKEAGLDFDEGVSRAYMLEMLCEELAWQPKDLSEDATHALIRIAKSPEQGGHLSFRGGFNGTMFTIQREQEVEIPIGFYNVIQEVNSLGFTISPMVKGEAKEASPVENRIQNTLYPVQVLRFINKGK
jgi:hypothetical protein